MAYIKSFILVNGLGIENQNKNYSTDSNYFIRNFNANFNIFDGGGIKMEIIFKIVLIIADVLVIARTDNKISKLFGTLAIIFLCLSLLGA